MGYWNPDMCMATSWTVEEESFSIDKGWIAGAFFLGLAVGGLLAFLIIPPCLRDWEKKKNADLFRERQDEEENILVCNEAEIDQAEHSYDDPVAVPGENIAGGKKSKFAAVGAFFNRKKGKKDADTQKTEQRGWVQSEGDKKTSSTGTGTDSIGMVALLSNRNSGEADANMVKQDIGDIDKMDEDQHNVKDDMKIKMLKMKLRKMKGKGQIGDPYLADFTQRIIEQRRANKEMIAMEKQEGEEEIKLKHKRNPAVAEQEMDNLNIRLQARARQLENGEDEFIRSELIRTSGLSDAEVDSLIDGLKADMAELDRRQALEQARQARHLAERLEKRRQLMEFRRLQEQQGREETVDERKAFDEPLEKLVQDGKLMDKQKKDILDEHERNLQNLQKQHELESMRAQRDLADKLAERRKARLQKVADKQQKEQASFLQKAEKSTNTAEFVAGYQSLLEQQQQEVENTEEDLDQQELQELEKLTQNLESQKASAVKETSDRMMQTVKQTGQLSDNDAKRIIKLHNMRMDSFDQRRKDEQQRMRDRLQERWHQRVKQIDNQEKVNLSEREAIIQQQDSTVQKVLASNIDLTDDAKDKIMKEHQRNMETLNNQLSRSKLKQQMCLQQKLSARKARLAEIQAQQEALKAEKKDVSEKELQKLQTKLDEEVLLFEKERKEAENNFRRRLALETDAAIAQQEKELAVLIGRLEVGSARRLAVLQKQDQQLKDLQEKLESQVESGRLSVNTADQIIQQHYNQVEHVNDSMQRSRQQQEAIIQEKIQAKKFQKQRELDDQMRSDKEELSMARRKAGAGLASTILNASLMEQRHKKAMEDLEKDMQIELERSREELNSQLAASLQKELETHKGQFLNQLAQATNSSANDIAAGRPRSAQRYSRDYQKSKSTLGSMEEDSDDEPTIHSYSRPKSSVGSKAEARLAAQGTPKKKHKHKFGPQPPRPAFSASSTGEQIHGMWDDDDF
ncbi:trichohyalin-like isoform X2 [Mya arenaria]|uniref:trichohyalin-like isoform X2 n=1 Tax=Mya arenaria TaxID=6604 RepID=UPI0022E5E53D|nr:trichohyalin-like isoform X2 [Mya arenaria]